MSSYQIEQRPAQPYVAIRIEVPGPDIGRECPPLIGEVMGWLQSQGLQADGPPIFRYLAFGERETIDVGWPVATLPAKPSGRVRADTLPAGRHASVLYTGPYDGLPGAAQEFMGAMERDKVPLAVEDLPNGGRRWGAFVEWYVTDPMAEPDPKKWQTRMTVLLKDR